MTLEDLILYLSRGAYVLLSLSTLINYLQYRDPIRRDIFLGFLCVSTGTIMLLISSITGLDLSKISFITPVALLAQPFITIRLVRYFRHVPRTIYVASFVGMIICWAVIALSVFSLNPNPLFGLTTATIIVVIYYTLFDGYAVIAFISGAFSSTGVTRQSLRFAAAGSGFLVLALLFGAVNVIDTNARAGTLPLIRIATLTSSICYFLAFVPPRWLRRAWQHAELRYYLEHLQVSTTVTLEDILQHVYIAISRGMGSNVMKVKVALWDETRDQLVLYRTSKPPDLTSNSHLDELAQEAWENRTTIVVDRSRSPNAKDRELLTLVGAETLLIVPVALYEKRLGELMVFLQYGTLFPDEDASLLTIFAQQMAIQLQYHTMLEEILRRNEDLELKIKERTLDLQRSNDELKMFAYVASHDLQEPLRTISSYLQLIDSRYTDKLDSEGREFIAFAVDGAARMKELIGDVLIYSRVETEKKNFTVFDSQKVVDDVIKSLEASINESGATITTDPMPQIKADKRLIMQLFQNLLSNAIKYRGTRKPEIFVSVEEQPGQWLFAVKDNGIGIETQYLDQIFIVFRRLHHREVYSGTGIGLAVCKKSVELHGGRIWAESVIGESTIFYFTLPK